MQPVVVKWESLAPVDLVETAKTSRQRVRNQPVGFSLRALQQKFKPVAFALAGGYLVFPGLQAGADRIAVSGYKIQQPVHFFVISFQRNFKQARQVILPAGTHLPAFLWSDAGGGGRPNIRGQADIRTRDEV